MPVLVILAVSPGVTVGLPVWVRLTVLDGESDAVRLAVEDSDSETDGVPLLLILRLGVAVGAGLTVGLKVPD